MTLETHDQTSILEQYISVSNPRLDLRPDARLSHVYRLCNLLTLKTHPSITNAIRRPSGALWRAAAEIVTVGWVDRDILAADTSTIWRSSRLRWVRMPILVLVLVVIILLWMSSRVRLLLRLLVAIIAVIIGVAIGCTALLLLLDAKTLHLEREGINVE